MPHECDDCGESFETLTRLRLHDCAEVSIDDGSSMDSSAFVSTSSSASSSDASIDELDDLLRRVSDGDSDAVHGAVATYESALASALDVDDRGDTYRDVFWPYYEQVGDALDEATRAEGWGVLADVIDAYDPTEGDGIPLASPAIENAVGRHVIRTRLTHGVERIPAAELEYLDAVAINADDADDVAIEETHAYGWGIGHPDHSVVERLHDRVSEDRFSVNPALEHAFYADQHAAVDALERLVTDESIDEAESDFMRDISYRRYLLDCVVGPDGDGYWPTTPRYWDWYEEFDYAFEWDDTVERRIRDLVVKAGFDADLPNDWTFRDLAI
jgi:hypothetical protein